MPSLLQARSRSFRPRLEALEDRWMPANVTASVTDGVLNLIAVSANSPEALLLGPGSSPGSVRVSTPAMSTTINNSATFEAVTGVNRIRIVMKGGDDRVSVGGLRLRGGLTFLGGDGANTFSMSSTRLGGNLTVLGGNNPTGLDMVTIEDGVLVGGLTTVSNGAGQSQVNVVDDTDLMGGLTVNGGPSNDSVQLLSTRLGGQLRVNLGAGSNDVTLSEVFLSGSAFFSGGPGDDVVFLHDIIVGGVTANLGNGNNKFTIDVPTNTVASTIGSRIARNLSVSTGTGMDVVALGSAAPVFLGGSVTIETGNEVGPGDGVSFNDTTCAGGVFIDLGNGNDRLAVEEVNTAAQVCNFAGSFSVLAGGGEDQVLLGILGDTAGKANFERKPRLNGGAGTGDILSPRNYSIGGIFLAPFTPTTFEQVVL